MTRIDMAASFLKLAAGGQVKEAYEQYIAPEFIHHNQYFKGDRASLMRAMEEAHKANPNKSFQVKRSFEDGDFVITHSLVTRAAPGERDIAVVHIFRFHGNQVVELWDLGQLIEKNSPNENGPF